MAYHLKGTGPATKAVAVFAVDSDGAVKCWTTEGAATDSAANGQLCVTRGITTGDSSFNSAGTRKYFETQSIASHNGGMGVILGPSWYKNLAWRTGSTGTAAVAVMAGYTGHGGTPGTSSHLVNFQRTSVNSLTISECVQLTTPASSPVVTFMTGSVARGVGTSAVTLNGTTKFTLGAQYLYTGTQHSISAGGQTFFAAEGGTGTFEPASPTSPSFLNNETFRLWGMGGTYAPPQAITAATKANPCQLTIAGTASGLVNTDRIVLYKMTGTGGGTDWSELDGYSYAVSNVTVGTDTTFTIGVDTTGYQDYSASSGYAYETAANRGSAGKYHVLMVCNQLLTEAEYDSIHDDWFGTLFDDVPSTVKKLKLLAHASAASATGVAGIVFAAPSGSDITGAVIGEFTGASFEASLESGQAVLKVPVADFGGTALTTSDTPVALAKSSSNTTGIKSCTVIEE